MAKRKFTGSCSTIELLRNEFSKIHLDFNLISFLLQPFMPSKKLDNDIFVWYLAYK